VLRDVHVRGKYRDVILPMTVLRRLAAVLEPTRQAVLDTKVSLDAAGVTDQAERCRESGPGVMGERRANGAGVAPAHREAPRLPR